MGDIVGRKPRLSGASAIYISSGSEDEDNVALSVDRGPDGGEAEVNDGYTDHDANTWADTGMILSAPPSPAPPASDVPTIPAAEVVLLNPVRASKFKPAPTATSKVDMRAPSIQRQTSAKNTSTSLEGVTKGEDDIMPRLVRRPPLLIARAKRNKGRDDDIIDLTSD